MGKGRQEAYSPFGELSEQYLKEWLAQYQPAGNIWRINEWGIISMFRRLEKATGLPCNPHTFRRTFACLFRKAGVDTMTIRVIKKPEYWVAVSQKVKSDKVAIYTPSLTNRLATSSRLNCRSLRGVVRYGFIIPASAHRCTVLSSVPRSQATSSTFSVLILCSWHSILNYLSSLRFYYE